MHDVPSSNGREMIQKRDLRDRRSGIYFPNCMPSKRHAKNQFESLVFRRDAQAKFNFPVQCKFETTIPCISVGRCSASIDATFTQPMNGHLGEVPDTAVGGGLRPAVAPTYETVSAEAMQYGRPR